MALDVVVEDEEEVVALDADSKELALRDFVADGVTELSGLIGAVIEFAVDCIPALDAGSGAALALAAAPAPAPPAAPAPGSAALLALLSLLPLSPPLLFSLPLLHPLLSNDLA